MSCGDVKVNKVSTGCKFNNWRRENDDMDYCARESTLSDFTPEVSPRQETVKTKLETIEKMLYETMLTQKSIIEGLAGLRNDEKGEKREEKCMEDTLATIQTLVGECMSQSRKISELLF